MTRLVRSFGIVLALASGCSDGSTAPADTGSGGTDTGSGGTDTGTGGTDTGTGGTDTGTGGTDTGTGGMDTGTGGTDTGVDAASSTDDAGSDAASASDANLDTNPFFPDGAIMCLPGVECTNWAAAIAAAPRNASGANMAQAVGNCVVQMHQSDCCGAMRAYGVNHGARGTPGMPMLCAAEAACTAMYPTPPDCSSDVIIVDTGATTTDPSLVRVRGVPSTSCGGGGVCVTCETVVCDAGDATCLSLEGIAPSQCGP